MTKTDREEVYKKAEEFVHSEEKARLKERHQERELQRARALLAFERKKMERRDPELGPARRKVRHYSWAAAAVAAAPWPLLDFIAITGVQVKLVSDLAEIFHQDFSEDWGKSAIGALVANSFSATAKGLVASFIKVIPIVGQAAGIIAQPILAFSSTYAIGRVFTMHFASGGTMLDFDPAEFREHFEAARREGEELASTSREDELSSSFAHEAKATY